MAVQCCCGIGDGFVGFEGTVCLSEAASLHRPRVLCNTGGELERFHPEGNLGSCAVLFPNFSVNRHKALPSVLPTKNTLARLV